MVSDMARTLTVNGPAARIICEQAGHANVSKIAAAVGVNRSTLSLIFSGRRYAGTDLARKLADLTGHPAHVFLGPSRDDHADLEGAA